MSHDVVTTGIVLQAHSPLGTPTRPPHYAKDDDPVIMEDPVVLDIAKKHNVHPALVRSVCKIITILHEDSTQWRTQGGAQGARAPPSALTKYRILSS